MEFYVACDNNGLHYFSDCPDLVKFNPYSEDIEWTGYPVDFGTYDKEIKALVEKDSRIEDLYPYDAPIHFKITEITIEIL